MSLEVAKNTDKFINEENMNILLPGIAQSHSKLVKSSSENKNDYSKIVK